VAKGYGKESSGYKILQYINYTVLTQTTEFCMPMRSSRQAKIDQWEALSAGLSSWKIFDKIQ
jgi:hypothetical protein